MIKWGKPYRTAGRAHRFPLGAALIACALAVLGGCSALILFLGQ